MSMDKYQDTVSAPVAKIATAWFGVGVATVIEYAQVISLTLASIYTLCLLGEWVWKKSAWMRRRNRRKYDR